MTDAIQPSGTPSTPEPSGSPAPVVAASPEPTSPNPAPVPAEPVVAAPVEGVPAEPATPVAPLEVQPLFKLPDDFKVRPEAQAKFESTLKGKMKDGTLQLTAQEVADLFVEQARDSFTSWQAQVTAQDKQWATESKTRFTSAQLAASETGVGFLSSFEPEFRELVKGFSNHPAFVNAMRVIGERLSEDTFEIEGTRAPVQKREAKNVLYPKRN